MVRSTTEKIENKGNKEEREIKIKRRTTPALTPP